ncbi:hypothetical protein HMPREF9098_0241 [Kingella denitrificans ATCC 33394]|uniref:Uncharacterized protein n=1 Tax=Kingella denitrificans ATCC 33394 TaxID=888741 RepID=F0EWK5_9NEIS|nr:hypothetical protein HMPREF9098_0241 [Kingella denitrificans ATCC 33394]
MIHVQAAFVTDIYLLQIHRRANSKRITNNPVPPAKANHQND